jgi:acyl carrier protein
MNVEGEVRAIITEALSSWDGNLDYLDRDALGSLLELELIMTIEDQFPGVRFPEDTELIQTPRQLIAYIKRYPEYADADPQAPRHQVPQDPPRAETEPDS